MGLQNTLKNLPGDFYSEICVGLVDTDPLGGGLKSSFKNLPGDFHSEAIAGLVDTDPLGGGAAKHIQKKLAW